MRPEIQRYLDEHGARYTAEALRQVLLDAGYEPLDVDTALREWEARATDPAAAASERRRFWWWALGLHAAVLVLIGILSLAIGSFTVAGWLALAILAPVLLLGVAISGAIGRDVLRRRGLTIALVVPAISALLIGGSCLAFGGSLVLQRPAPPPRAGVMELRIEPPLTFDGSGAATCEGYRDLTGFRVFAENLGTLDGSQVNVSIEAYRSQESPAAEVSASLYISLISSPEAHQQVDYTNAPTSRLELDASSDGLSGTATFQALEPATGEAAPGDVPGNEPISGSISWRCE